jgi:cytochrome bd-type quinol oxidase subunit 1
VHTARLTEGQRFAAIEARWHDEQPASEVLIAWPDEAHERNRLALSIPYLGSLIASASGDEAQRPIGTSVETSRDVRIVPHDRLINVGDPFNRIVLNTCL